MLRVWRAHTGWGGHHCVWVTQVAAETERAAAARAVAREREQRDALAALNDRHLQELKDCEAAADAGTRRALKEQKARGRCWHPTVESWAPASSSLRGWPRTSKAPSIIPHLGRTHPLGSPAEWPPCCPASSPVSPLV